MTAIPKIPVPDPLPKPLPNPLRLKHWTFAGLLITYWCNARCAFCYVYSGPNKKGPTLTVDQALSFWRSLNRLLEEDGLKIDGGGAPLPCKIHFAGGEPFYDFDRLLAIANAAKSAGLKHFEKVETNAFWAKDAAETRRRLQLLKDAGMQMLMISADVYHQEFVPVERCRRAADIAREILGDQGVRVRWWDSLQVEQDVLALPEPQRRHAFADALVRHRERLLGRAADQLADLYECHPPEHFRQQHCAEATLASKHVHIDAYGNVFPGVCSGIIWGRIASPAATPLLAPSPPTPETPAADPAVWPSRFPSIHTLWRYAAAWWPKHPIIGRVVEGGSYRLYEFARDQGFVARSGGYANKCHLCHDVRRWLYHHGFFASTLGPEEVYDEVPKGEKASTGGFSLPVLNDGGEAI